MYQRVKAYVEAYHMLGKEDRVIAGISGGADSICLLFVLLELKKELGFDLVAVHVHHGLRGASADRDEAYVRQVCKEQKVPLEVFRRDVRAYAKERGLTEEEAGREVRREAFLECAARRDATRIALAHHRNDNAETVLFHLCRGSSLEGLSGIPPVSGCWIHPLLCVDRGEIESYLEKRGISYCTDETNREMCYTRNRIRGRVIPCLEENVNPRAMEHIADTARRLRLAAEFVREEAGKCRQVCVRQEKDGEILLEEPFRKLSLFLRREVLYETICRAAGTRKDIGAVHVRLAEGLLEKQVGRRIDMPGDAGAERCYEGLRFFRKSQGDLPEVPGEFKMRVFDRPEGMERIPQKTYTKWFDYDIIKCSLSARTRQGGDYLVINESGGRQKLKAFFVNEKIPREERDRMLLIADGDHIVWIPGRRMSRAYQVSSRTEKILEIKITEETENGRDDQGFSPGGEG